MDSHEAQSPSEQPEEERQPASEPQVLQRGDIREGTILSVDEEGARVDLGFEHTALVPAHDLEKLSSDRREDLRAGEPVSVYITTPEDRKGDLVVSIHQAVLNEKWLEAEQLKESAAIWEGKVTGYNQGGVIVAFGRLRGFVPISHLRGMPRRANSAQIRELLGNYVGRTLPLRVIEADRRRRRLILSHRLAYQQWRQQQRQAFVDSLKEGEVRTGRVRDLRDFGAFVDLGGGDGLIHISELAWHRINHPKEVLRVGQHVQVYVLKVNRRRKRVSLSLKRMTPHPWSTIHERYQVDQLVEGRITRVVSFGGFVELEPGIEGLLHVRQLPGTARDDPNNVIAEGEAHLLRILDIDAERRRIRLSMRAVKPEEQMEWMAAHAEKASALVEETIGLAELIDEEE